VYDNTLSRVELTADSLGASATYAVVERSLNAAATDALWAQGVVRGGEALPVASQEAELKDAEFFPDVPTHYRVTSFDASDVQQQQFTTSITASLAGRVWLKSPRYPFLNRPLFRILDRGGDLRRPDRGALVEIAGRSAPTSLGERAGSRRFSIAVQVADEAEAAALDLVLAVAGAGQTMFIHVPADKPQVPGGYVHIHTTEQARANDRERWVFTLPCTVANPPPPQIVGSTLTWGTVERLYGSWTALLAAHPTWASLLATVGDPDDLVAI
jgi:hypothetical protein